MIANKWYCIAQTSTFDSGCIINVSFDGHLVQFSASVKYGASAINIPRCELPSNITLSVRLRESAGLWSVDLLCNEDIYPEVVVADSPFWTSVTSVAGSGEIILSLNNITREYNTETGGSGGGLDMDALQDFLDKNGYTALLGYWKYEETAGGTLRTRYNILVEGGGAFGKDAHISDDGGGGEGGLSKFYIQIGEGGKEYELGNTGRYDVVQIPKYPVVPTNVSAFFNDAGYIGGEVINEVNRRIGKVEADVEILKGYWYVDDNGNLHTTYNIVVDQGGAFGKGATSEGGSTGGLGSVTLKTENGVQYKSGDDGVVNIPNWITASSLNGYATQSWVEGKKYLTSVPAEYVTETELTNKGYAVASDVAKTYATKTELTATNTNLGTISTGLANLSTKVGTIETNLSGITERVGSAETTIKSHTASIATNTANIAINAGNISTNTANITKVSNRVTELEKYWKIDANGNLHTTYNIVVDGGGAFGEGATSGGGSGSGLGSVIIKTEAGLEYRTNADGVVVIPNYITASALNGYATESFVTSKGYITSSALNGYATQSWVGANYLPLSGGTMQGDITLTKNVFIRSGSNGYAIIGIDGDKVLLGSHDYHTQIRSNTTPTAIIGGTQYTLYHTGNFNPANYLLTSGGVIDGSLQIGTDANTSYNYLKLVRNGTYMEINCNEYGGYINYNSSALRLQSGTITYEGNTLLHSGNYSSYVLPLTGGELNGTLYLQKDTAQNYIVFKGPNNTIRGYLGFDGTDNPMYIPSAGNVVHSLIHSGNIGLQSVSYASSAGTADMLAKSYSENINYTLGSALKLIRDWTEEAESKGFAARYQAGLSVVTDYVGWQMTTSGGSVENPYFRSMQDTGAWKPWRQIAFLTDNVASATKLETARTIWGQSFDGTGNVSGNLILGYNKIYLAKDNENYCLGWNGNSELEYNNYYGHIFKTSSAERMRITTNGNVLIGTNTDNGYKATIASSAFQVMEVQRLQTSVGYGAVIRFSTQGETLGDIGWNKSGDLMIRDGVTKLIEGGITSGLKINTNLIVSGGGAFGSDARYKDILDYTNIDLATIADAPLFTYKWNDREDDKVYLGTTAQYWLDTNFRDAVNISNPKFFHLDYGALGVGIGISVAKEVTKVKSKVELLEERVNELENELKQYRQWHN